MKKRSLLSLLALLILLALSVSAGADELPGEIRSALEGTGMEILKIWQGPILLISCDNGDFFAYERTAPGQWDLLSAFYLEEQVHVDFIDGEVKYRTPIDQNNNRIITVRAPLERDLRKVDITRIPKTPEAALKETEQEKE